MQAEVHGDYTFPSGRQMADYPDAYAAQMRLRASTAALSRCQSAE